MKRTRLSVLLGLLAAFTLLVGVSAVYPSVDDLWVENPFWNGLSEFYRETKPTRLEELTQLGDVPVPGNSTLFMIGPSTEFSPLEVTEVNKYIVRGGTVVLADDFGTGNQLLEGLGLETRFDKGLLNDPIFRDGNALMPLVTLTDSVMVLNHATVLDLGGDARATAWSSPYAYVISVDEAPRPSMIPQPVIAEVVLGLGRLVLVSDSSPLINSMIDRGGNRGLLDMLARGEVMIDEGHSIPSTLTQIKQVLTYTYTVLGNLEIRYGLALLMVAGVSLIKLGEEAEHVDEVEALMRRHPEYDRRLVERLHRERVKAGGR